MKQDFLNNHWGEVGDKEDANILAGVGGDFSVFFEVTKGLLQRQKQRRPARAAVLAARADALRAF
jgi:hypothetical protein